MGRSEQSAYATRSRAAAALRGLRIPGSYGTTEADGDLVRTGAEAVERYALANDEPASYRFTIKPLKDTKIKKGIVQPANNHRGGGVEVIFTEGTTRDTVAQPPTQLPDN